jgi:hypothetical protein
VPEVQFDLRYFKNEPQKCKANVIKRGSKSVELQLKKIDEYSSQYAVPSHSVSVLQVEG